MKLNKSTNYVFLFFNILFVFYANAKIIEFELTLENHVFTPSVLIVPVNEKMKLIIENKDEVAEEFDSFDLNREKVIFARKKITIYIGPLSAGSYEYFGEYHPNSARGKIITKEQIK